MSFAQEGTDSSPHCETTDILPSEIDNRAIDRPHLMRTSLNLLAEAGNPTIIADGDASTTSVEGWLLEQGAEFDPSESHTLDESGSLKLYRFPTLEGCDRCYDFRKTHVVRTSNVAIDPKKPYTFSFFMKTNSALGKPIPELKFQYEEYSEAPEGITTKKWINHFIQFQSNSEKDEWQECVYLMRVNEEDPLYSKGIVQGRMVVVPLYQPDLGPPVNPSVLTEAEAKTQTIWVDDFYIGEGIGFANPPTGKTAFQSEKVRIDALGNIEIRRDLDEDFTPFFPLGMYGSGGGTPLTRYQMYADQGFNMDMRTVGEHVSAVQAAGLMSAYDISRTARNVKNQKGSPTNPTFDSESYDGLETTTQPYRELPNFLWYYWDNEAIGHRDWQHPFDAVTEIRRFDPDHPVYVLNGQPSISRSLEPMSDVTGAYYRKGAVDHIVQQNLEHQTRPVVITQFTQSNNDSVDDGHSDLRAKLYIAIAKGAKGMGYFRDNYSDKDESDPTREIPVEELAWWPDFKNVSYEIKKMIWLIREPHWTPWGITAPNGIEYGTRDHKGLGHIIAINDTGAAIADPVFVVDAETLGYSPAFVKDFFTGEPVATFEMGGFIAPSFASKFPTNLSPETDTHPEIDPAPTKTNCTAVYVLEKEFQKSLVLNLNGEFTQDADGKTMVLDSSEFSNHGTPKGNVSSSDGGILEFDGSGDYISFPASDSLNWHRSGMTILTRIRLESTSGPYTGIVTKGAGQVSDKGYAFVYRHSTHGLSLVLSDGVKRSFLTSDANLNLNDKKWHVVGVTLAPDGTANFFVDGKLTGSDSSNLDYSDIGRDLRIGAWGLGHRLNGGLDNVRIYGLALDSQEMSTVLDLRFNEQSEESN